MKISSSNLTGRCSLNAAAKKNNGFKTIEGNANSSNRMSIDLSQKVGQEKRKKSSHKRTVSEMPESKTKVLKVKDYYQTNNYI